MSSVPRSAIAISVKNEAELLRKNLLYHHYLGIDRIYVFDDGSTDGTRDTISDLDFVIVQSNADPADFAGRTEVQIFIDNHAIRHPARQALNVLFASEHARKDGFDWIFSLDTDELICLDLHTSKKNQLKKFLTDIPPEYESIRFKNLEVVQRKINYTNVFAEEILFKIYNDSMKKSMYDPIAKEYFTIRGFYGQGKGKSGLRLNCEGKHHTVHNFVGLKDDRMLKTYNVPEGLLHYYIYDYDDFYRHTKNYSALPNVRMRGSTVERQKRVWRDYVNLPGVTDEEIFNYYQNSIMYTESEVRKMLSNKYFGIFSRKPRLQEVTAVGKAFREMGL